MAVVNNPVPKLVVVLVLSIAYSAQIDPLLNETLVSVNNVLHFLETYGSTCAIVPDILFGVVLALGQIRVLLRHLQQNYCTVDLSTEDMDKLTTSLFEHEHVMSRILQDARKNVVEDEYQWFNTMVDKLLVPELWEVDKQLTAGLLPVPHDTSNITLDLYEMMQILYRGLPNESVSDSCIGDVVGARSSSCQVSSYCSSVELEAGPSTGYALTHRLLYIQAARQTGCNKIGSPETVSTYVEHFCGQILNDAQFIDNLDFPECMQDLFSEQVVLCGIEGFREFFKPRWVKKLLSWQRPEGCFGNKAELEKLTKLANSRRQKREDGVMAFNCSMHFTGVALGAIAASIRSMVECADS